VSILSSLDAFAGSFPFETFLALNYCLTLVYNLINCHLWNARARLFSMPFSNRSFLADPLSTSRNKEFVFSLLIFRVSSSRLVNQEFGPRAEEFMNRTPKHRSGESEWIRLRS
jgi:hypothetical protein